MKNSINYTLEPLTIGEIIDRTLLLIKDHWKQYLVPAGIYAGPMMILFLASMAMGFMGFDPQSAPVLLLNLVNWIVNWILSLMLTATVIRMTQTAIEYGWSSYKDAFQTLFNHFFPFMGTLILGVFIFFGIGVAGSLIAFVFFIPSILTREAFTMIFIVIGFVVAFLFIMYFLAMFFMGPTIAITEKRFGIAAFKRSMQLFNTNWETKWKVIMLPGLTQILVVIFTAFIPFAGYFLALILSPLPVIALTLAYYDIRIRTEGLDMQMEIDRMATENEGYEPAY